VNGYSLYDMAAANRLMLSTVRIEILRELPAQLQRTSERWTPPGVVSVRRDGGRIGRVRSGGSPPALEEVAFVDVRLLAAARMEFLEAQEFYKDRSFRLAEDFVSEFERLLNIVRSIPLAGSPFREGTRRMLMRQIRYSLRATYHNILWYALCRRGPAPSGKGLPEGLCRLSTSSFRMMQRASVSLSAFAGLRGSCAPHVGMRGRPGVRRVACSARAADAGPT
jgi:hypothetical protein